MTGIRLIAGLGNVGREYERTRHNAGFWFVDALAGRVGAAFATEAKFHADVARASLRGRGVWLLKPRTYMNRSGLAVAAIANFYKITPAEILVAYDELDLPPGTARLKRGGGNAGHNGLRDIQARCGSADFWRLRLGIGHPRTLELRQEVADFVLHPPSGAHLAAIEEAIARGLDRVDELVDGAFEAAMQALHTNPDDGARTRAR